MYNTRRGTQQACTPLTPPTPLHEHEHEHEEEEQEQPAEQEEEEDDKEEIRICNPFILLQNNIANFPN